MNRLILSIAITSMLYGNSLPVESHEVKSKFKHIHQGKSVYWSNGIAYKRILDEQRKLKEKPIEASKPVAVVKETVKPEVKTPVPQATVTPEPVQVVAPPKPVTPDLPKLPVKAYKYLPDLVEAIDTTWNTIPMRSFLPGLIEQESCISLTHRKCWDPTVELKTNREYGFGLGQFTRAYNANKTIRFDTWQELRDRSDELRGWSWENRFNPLMQIKALLIKNRINFNKLTFNIKDTDNKMAFLAATYNGGSVLKDRSICISRNDCDPSAWLADKKVKPFAVESFSFKSKSVHPGYGKSFFAISREYPRNILFIRRPKYIPHVGN
jgi:hypothetical protein